jgi:hypothetical protein
MSNKINCQSCSGRLCPKCNESIYSHWELRSNTKDNGDDDDWDYEAYCGGHR